jgi:hypothetical protein
MAEVQTGAVTNLDRGGDSDNEDEDQEEYLTVEARKRKLYYIDPERAHGGDKLTKINLEEDPNIRNHIIVCGLHTSIEEFIMPLRSKYLKENQLQKIVIITGEQNEQIGGN